MFARSVRYLKAMPQYHVGHLARVEAIEQCVARHPGLALAGGAYRGVGIADCVRSGEEAVERLLGRSAEGHRFVTPSSARSTYGKYASRADLGRRPAAGPFSSL